MERCIDPYADWPLFVWSVGLRSHPVHLLKSRSTLPPVVVEAPERRQDIGIKPKQGADRGRRAKRSAPRNPASVANAASGANAAGTSVAATPVMSSSEKNVSGAESTPGRFLGPRKRLKSFPG